jgi:hypothetical protein
MVRPGASGHSLGNPILLAGAPHLFETYPPRHFLFCFHEARELNPYESSRNAPVSLPSANAPRVLIAAFLGLIALGCGVLAAFVFVVGYPWSQDPRVNPFAQASAMFLSMVAVGTVAAVTTGMLLAVTWALVRRSVSCRYVYQAD